MITYEELMEKWKLATEDHDCMIDTSEFEKCEMCEKVLDAKVYLECHLYDILQLLKRYSEGRGEVSDISERLREAAEVYEIPYEDVLLVWNAAMGRAAEECEMVSRTCQETDNPGQSLGAGHCAVRSLALIADHKFEDASRDSMLRKRLK